MAAAVAQPRLIESLYAPEELATASPGRRLDGYALDTLFLIITLFIGWLIWFIIVAPRGQTPSKQLLGMYVMREDGSRAGGGYMWLREFVVEGIVFGVLISGLTGGAGLGARGAVVPLGPRAAVPVGQGHRDLRCDLAAGLPPADSERAARAEHGAAGPHPRAAVGRSGGAAGRGSGPAG